MGTLIEKYPDGSGPFGSYESQTVYDGDGSLEDAAPGSMTGTTYSDADGNWVACAMGVTRFPGDGADDEDDEDDDPLDGTQPTPDGPP